MRGEFYNPSEQAFWANQQQVEQELAGTARVAGLATFLGKSTRPSFLREAFVSPYGFKAKEHSRFGDRQFMVTNLSGKMESQRSLPTLALLEITDLGDELLLTFHGDKADPSMKPSIPSTERRSMTFKPNLDEDQSTQKVATSVHDTKGIVGIDQGERVSAWLTSMFGAPLRLVWQAESQPRVRENSFPNAEGLQAMLRFADSTPYTAISFTTLDIFNRALQNHPELASLDAYFEAISFRMNILFAGEINEHLAVGKFLKIGEVYFYCWRPKERCALPATHQKTGLVRGENKKRPAKSLKHTYQDVLRNAQEELAIPEAWRTKPNSKPEKPPIVKPSLGVDMIPINQGIIRLDNPIEIVDELPAHLVP
jgi:uncharacterized protein YcbX